MKRMLILFTILCILPVMAFVAGKSAGAGPNKIQLLRSELAKQKEIFKKNMGRAINPDNSKEYTIAKKAFDQADRRIKEIEKELARLLSGKNLPPGAQLAPSQSKVIVSP